MLIGEKVKKDAKANALKMLNGDYSIAVQECVYIWNIYLVARYLFLFKCLIQRLNKDINIVAV